MFENWKLCPKLVGLSQDLTFVKRSNPPKSFYGVLICPYASSTVPNQFFLYFAIKQVLIKFETLQVLKLCLKQKRGLLYRRQICYNYVIFRTMCVNQVCNTCSKNEDTLPKARLPFHFGLCFGYCSQSGVLVSHFVVFVVCSIIVADFFRKDL